MSSRLRDEFDNGDYYRQFDGRAIRLPANVVDRPSPEFLEWHGDVVYQD